MDGHITSFSCSSLVRQTRSLLHGEHNRHLFCLSMHYSLDRLALYCVIGVLKLLTEIFPYFLDLSSTIIEFHRTNLTYYDMMIEATIIALVLICKCHVRWICFSYMWLYLCKHLVATHPPIYPVFYVWTSPFQWSFKYSIPLMYGNFYISLSLYRYHI